jgi:large subunit ribosomal protein L25
MVPCVVYGGDKAVHFSAAELAFSKLVYTPNAHTVVIDLDNGTSINAILQDLQFHPVSDKILHVDFYQLFDDKDVTMNIPVNVIGSAPGVLAGGVLSLNQRKLRVRALPANLPDFIEADVSELNIGSKLFINKLENDKYTFLQPANTVVAQVRVSRAAMKAAQDDAKAEANSDAPAAADAE